MQISFVILRYLPAIADFKTSFTFFFMYGAFNLC